MGADPAAVFQPVAVLPDPPSRRTTPEIRLLVALLDDAIGLATGRYVPTVGGDHTSRGRANAQRCVIEEAREWITRGDVGAITFDDTCGALGLDPGLVRAALLRKERRR